MLDWGQFHGLLENDEADFTLHEWKTILQPAGLSKFST